MWAVRGGGAVLGLLQLPAGAGPGWRGGRCRTARPVLYMEDWTDSCLLETQDCQNNFALDGNSFFQSFTVLASPSFLNPASNDSLDTDWEENALIRVTGYQCEVSYCHAN